MRCLMWFRSDLRVGDNTALLEATRAATRGVVGLFVISPGEWAEHDAAPARIGLVLRTLRVLSADLARRNIPLLIAHAPTRRDVPGVVAAEAARAECDAVYWNREYEVNERRRDERTAELLKAAGRRTASFTDQCLIEPGDVRTGEGRWYTVFTPFKKAACAYLVRHGGVHERASIPTQPAMPTANGVAIAPGAVPDAVEGFVDPIAPDLWPGGEHHAREQLRAFVGSAILKYKVRRDFPGEPGTSALSPYLAIGAISPRACVAAAVGANAPRPREGGVGESALSSGNDGVVQWIGEVLWREFYIHITAGFPRVCMGRAFQPATEAIRWSENDEHFERWSQGLTGVPIVDAGMRQLRRIGWMHNRVRMIAAMYLTKNLFIDWRRGERWFMRHLADGFLASNNGGWQWSASTGTDAAPYFRVFNPASQSLRFDPDGAYIRRYVPELAGLEPDAVHAPWELPGLHRQRLKYPSPLVDLGASRQRAIDAFRALRGVPADSSEGRGV